MLCWFMSRAYFNTKYIIMKIKIAHFIAFDNNCLAETQKHRCKNEWNGNKWCVSKQKAIGWSRLKWKVYKFYLKQFYAHDTTTSMRFYKRPNESLRFRNSKCERKCNMLPFGVILFVYEMLRNRFELQDNKQASKQARLAGSQAESGGRAGHLCWMNVLSS